MPAITVRNLSEETHRALKARARTHGRSTEAEVRAILHDAVSQDSEVGLGTKVARISAEVGGFDLDLERDRSDTPPIDLA
ncbi:MAG: FitA-like ribbon-helix-helix domain-containing protein [Nocardioides sp.]